MNIIFIKLDSDWNGVDINNNPISLPGGIPLEITPAIASLFDINKVIDTESLSFEFNDFSGRIFRADEISGENDYTNKIKIRFIFDKLRSFHC